MTPLISKSISATRLPIILGPVMIHCQNMFSATPYRLFWGEMVGRIAVPLFFIISGYLFFQGFDGTFASLKVKLMKRIKSLLIPYIIWNLIAFFFYWSIGKCEGDDFLASFWIVDYHGGHSPADGPLWFLRTLIFLLPLTPLMYFINHNKFLRWFSIVVYMALFTGVSLFTKGFVIGFACFNLGAFIAKNEIIFGKLSLANSRKNLFMIFTYIIFIVCCIFDYVFYSEKSIIWFIVHWTMITTGSIILMIIPQFINEKLIIILNRLGKASFFIFCLHDLLVPYVCQIIQKCFGNYNVGYTVSVVFVVSTCYVIYYSMLQICPKTLSLLNGGR